MFSLNNEVCSTHGFSPFFLYFLRYPHSSLSKLSKQPVSKYSDAYVSERLRLLSGVLRRAREQQARAQANYKYQHDRRHRSRDVRIVPGDQIWLKNFGARSKFDDPWVGPLVVVSREGRRHLSYMDKKGSVRRTHLKNVKLVEERQA